MTPELRLWAAQEVLLGVLRARPEVDTGGPAEVPVDIGFPADVQPSHIWLTGEASGSLTDELSGGGPELETFRLSLVVYVQAPEEYQTVAGEVRRLASATCAAMDEDAVRAVVDAWTLAEYRLEEGTDGTSRQLALTLGFDCRCW